MAGVLVWQPCGLITLCPKNWPKFPPMPESPGLYRITLNDGRFYIGEARHLKKRLYNYRRPTPGIEQEYRVYAALVAAQGGKIEIYTDGNLSTRVARMKLEKAEIDRAIAAKLPLLNNDGDADPVRLKAQIKYLEGELDKARNKLSDMEVSQMRNKS